MVMWCSAPPPITHLSKNETATTNSVNEWVLVYQKSVLMHYVTLWIATGSFITSSAPLRVNTTEQHDIRCHYSTLSWRILITRQPPATLSNLFRYEEFSLQCICTFNRLKHDKILSGLNWGNASKTRTIKLNRQNYNLGGYFVWVWSAVS
jgi:hypothetical protein